MSQAFPIVGLTVGMLVFGMTACGGGGTGTASSTTPTTSGSATTPATSPTTTTAAVARGKFSSPSSGASIPAETTATGIVTNAPQGSQVWVVVEIGVFYPQDGPYRLLPDGGWTGKIFVGAPGDAGKTFLLHLVVTGPAGTKQFTDYLQKGRDTGTFPGVTTTSLASDVKFLDTVTVIRG